MPDPMHFQIRPKTHRGGSSSKKEPFAAYRKNIDPFSLSSRPKSGFQAKRRAKSGHRGKMGSPSSQVKKKRLRDSKDREKAGKSVILVRTSGVQSSELVAHIKSMKSTIERGGALEIEAESLETSPDPQTSLTPPNFLK